VSACGVPTRSLTVTASREAATEAATTSVPHNAGKAANRHGLITRPLWSRPSPEPRCTAKRETVDFFESGHVHARKRTPRRRLFRTVLPKCNGQATRSRLKDAAKFIGLIRPWCHARHCGGLTADVSRLSRLRAASRSRCAKTIGSTYAPCQSAAVRRPSRARAMCFVNLQPEEEMGCSPAAKIHAMVRS